LQISSIFFDELKDTTVSIPVDRCAMTHTPTNHPPAMDTDNDYSTASNRSACFGLKFLALPSPLIAISTISTTGVQLQQLCQPVARIPIRRQLALGDTTAGTAWDKKNGRCSFATFMRALILPLPAKRSNLARGS
jgi:hypothetical protein